MDFIFASFPFWVIYHVCVYLSFPFWNEGKRKPNSQILENLKGLWNPPSSQKNKSKKKTQYSTWDFLERIGSLFLEMTMIFICLDLRWALGKVECSWRPSFWVVEFLPMLVSWASIWNQYMPDPPGLWCDHRRSLRDSGRWFNDQFLPCITGNLTLSLPA
jgi:hypothetical protein